MSLSLEKLVVVCSGVKFFSALTLEFDFCGLEERIGVESVILAVCAEAAMAGVPRKVVVKILLDEEEYDDHIDQIEEELGALKQAWGVVSAALSRIPGTGRVDLVTAAERN